LLVKRARIGGGGGAVLDNHPSEAARPIATAPASAASRWWTEEPASSPDRARIRARNGGLHCSLCGGTIEEALGRKPGVDKVAVSLTHEQALIEFDQGRIDATELLQTLRDIGYTLCSGR